MSRLHNYFPSLLPRVWPPSEQWIGDRSLSNGLWRSCPVDSLCHIRSSLLLSCCWLEFMFWTGSNYQLGKSMRPAATSLRLVGLLEFFESYFCACDMSAREQWLAQSKHATSDSWQPIELLQWLIIWQVFRSDLDDWPGSKPSGPLAYLLPCRRPLGCSCSFTSVTSPSQWWKTNALKSI